MREAISSIIGNEEGPTSIILAGVHGDEQCGVYAMEHMLPTLRIDKGEVYYGYGNPAAIAVNKRCIERNLNRMFVDESKLSPEDMQSYEYQRAQYLKQYLDKSEALLDIHSHPWKEKKTFVICEPHAEYIVRLLPTGTVVSGFDAVEPGGVDYYMNSIGKIGICFECGYLDDEHSRNAAREAIVSFLKARGHIVNDLVPQTQSHIQIFQKYYTKTGNFQLSRPFTNFERLAKGELIGREGTEAVVAPKESVILFARNGFTSGVEVFLLGEDMPQQRC